MLESSFFVRILIYGLAGFVPSDNGTTIVLPELLVPKHETYVAFDAGCEGRACGLIRPFGGNSFPGFLLTGHRVIIGSLTDTGTASGGVRPPRPRRSLPQDAVHAKSLEWIPSMANVLEGSGNTGRIHPDCLARDPRRCRTNISGRIHFNRGQTLQTCQLINARGVFPGLDRITAFDFKRNRSGEPSLTQALTEIVEVVARVDGTELRLTLEPFAGDPVTVTLRPKSCGEGAMTKCVDIYLANVPEISSDIDDSIEGRHFVHLYNLLEVRPREARFLRTPVRNFGNSIGAEGIQSPCRSVLATLNALKKDADSAYFLQSQESIKKNELFEASRDFYLLSPEIRPVCPMASFSP